MGRLDVQTHASVSYATVQVDGEDIWITGSRHDQLIVKSSKADEAASISVHRVKTSQRLAHAVRALFTYSSLVFCIFLITLNVSLLISYGTGIFLFGVRNDNTLPVVLTLFALPSAIIVAAVLVADSTGVVEDIWHTFEFLHTFTWSSSAAVEWVAAGLTCLLPLTVLVVTLWANAESWLTITLAVTFACALATHVVYLVLLQCTEFAVDRALHWNEDRNVATFTLRRFWERIGDLAALETVEPLPQSPGLRRIARWLWCVESATRLPGATVQGSPAALATYYLLHLPVHFFCCMDTSRAYIAHSSARSAARAVSSLVFAVATVLLLALVAGGFFYLAGDASVYAAIVAFVVGCCVGFCCLVGKLRRTAFGWRRALRRKAGAIASDRPESFGAATLTAADGQDAAGGAATIAPRSQTRALADGPGKGPFPEHPGPREAWGAEAGHRDAPHAEGVARSGASSGTSSGASGGTSSDEARANHGSNAPSPQVHEEQHEGACAGGAVGPPRFYYRPRRWLTCALGMAIVLVLYVLPLVGVALMNDARRLFWYVLVLGPVVAWLHTFSVEASLHHRGEALYEELQRRNPRLARRAHILQARFGSSATLAVFVLLFAVLVLLVVALAVASWSSDITIDDSNWQGPVLYSYERAAPANGLQYPQCAPQPQLLGLSVLDMAHLASVVYVDVSQGDGAVQAQLDAWFGAGRVELLGGSLVRPSGDAVDDAVRNASLKGCADGPCSRRFGLAFWAVHFAEFNATVVSVRGSASALDWLQNMELWLPALTVQIGRSLLPAGSVWDPLLPYIIGWSGVTDLASDSFRYYAMLNAIVAAAAAARPTANVLLTGHSLGGGVAIISAAENQLPAVTFSAPGASYSRRRFDISDDHLDRYALNFKPRFDPVAMVGGDSLLFQSINCKSGGDQTGFMSCHDIERTKCELVDACGSMGRPVGLEDCAAYGYTWAEEAIVEGRAQVLLDPYA